MVCKNAPRGESYHSMMKCGESYHSMMKCDESYHSMMKCGAKGESYHSMMKCGAKGCNSAPLNGKYVYV